MYLPDYELAELCRTWRLVEPYDPMAVNPASVDLRLGREFVNLSDRPVVYYGDATCKVEDIVHPGDRFHADGVWLEPGVALLATTLEYVRIPTTCAAQLLLKSSSARKGLDHALAGWIDPGFEGELTLEIHAHRPIELVAGTRMFQMTVAKMLGEPAKPYSLTGRYQGQRGPTEAR